MNQGLLTDNPDKLFPIRILYKISVKGHLCQADGRVIVLRRMECEVGVFYRLRDNMPGCPFGKLERGVLDDRDIDTRSDFVHIGRAHESPVRYSVAGKVILSKIWQINTFCLDSEPLTTAPTHVVVVAEALAGELDSTLAADLKYRAFHRS